jgi:hypothetical protein
MYSGPEINLRGGDSIDISSGNNEIKGNTVLLQYEPKPVTEAATQATCTAYAGVVAGVAAAVTSAGVALAATNKGDVKTGSLVNQTAAGVVSLAALAVQAAGLVAWRKNSVASKAVTKTPIGLLPFVKIEEQKITLKCGMASIELNYDGSVEINGTDIKLTQEVGGVPGSKLSLAPQEASLNNGINGFSVDKTESTFIFGGTNMVSASTQGIEVFGAKIGFS